MVLRASVLVGLSALLAIACGGSVDSGGATSSSSSSGGGGSSSGGSDGSSGGGSCSSAAVKGNRACVPGTARAGEPITVDVDATDGCLGCFTTLDACKVSVSGDRIVLGMSATTCPPAGNRECPAVCMIPSVKCTIPALAAGSYTVEVAGEPERNGLTPRTLVVTDDASASSCALLQPGTPAPPLDGSKYAKSCSSDDDCVPARMGDPCKLCACPDTAIAKADAEKYASDFRASSSQCPSQGSAALCAACAPVKAACEIDPSALTGTCKLVPAKI